MIPDKPILEKLYNAIIAGDKNGLEQAVGDAAIPALKAYLKNRKESVYVKF